MNEIEFNNRLRYVAFKRLVIVMELLLLVVLLGFVACFRVPTPWYEAIITIQLSRTAAEIGNHIHLQTQFTVRDRWLLFPIG